MGNRWQKTDTVSGATTTENSTFDAANRILTRATQTYTSDLDGNTLADGTRTMTWDSQNRLTHCLKAAAGANPAIATDFYYGTDGLRRQKIATTAGNATPVVTNSVLDSGMLLRETNGSGQSVATYLVGARGPECKRDDARGGLARWYVFDGLGSVVGEVDPNGNVTTARNLDVYGAARGTTYTAAGEKPSKQAFVGSLGHTTDAETGGLVYMRARYMDTVTGRFISEDPAMSGKNWFLYCRNNPTNLTDMTGHSSEIDSLFVQAQAAFMAWCNSDQTLQSRGIVLLRLMQIIKQLKQVAKVIDFTSNLEMEQGVQTASGDPFAGAEINLVEEEVGIGEEGAGAIGKAMTTVDKLYVKQLEALIEIVKDTPTM